MGIVVLYLYLMEKQEYLMENVEYWQPINSAITFWLCSDSYSKKFTCDEVDY